jgi:hypothetical protein
MDGCRMIMIRSVAPGTMPPKPITVDLHHAKTSKRSDIDHTSQGNSNTCKKNTDRWLPIDDVRFNMRFHIAVENTSCLFKTL